MRKAQKQEVLEFINSLHQAHQEIKEALGQKDSASAKSMFAECQDFAVSLGENIERMEGAGHITVSHLEEYCEALFHCYENVEAGQFHENKIYKTLRKQLLKVENSVRNDILERKEIVFFPYKASMWDSLESVYLAAKEDPECDVYCVPIPYYELNPDRSFGVMHYEGMEYPENIEVIDWQTYFFEERKPDVIYIHNPYDEWNLVTSVHPRYYSANLKKYTDILVYIPYYSTSGGMSEAQSLCPAYLYADYIIIQAPGYRKYFDPRIPDEKFLPFGSPKFDKTIKVCQNPPIPSAEWERKMVGRKVYFYNTSITGMLEDTESFLRKIDYVFQCFQERDDACLLWRPHPLLESTFDSMRSEYKIIFQALKKKFIENDLGIYDSTSDIEATVGLCDVYIGDSGSSVTSLFGIAGKPIFILNNKIHKRPDEDSWRGEIINLIPSYRREDENVLMITQGNKLYASESALCSFKYLCDLSRYAYGSYYMTALRMNGKISVCPYNAQDILVVGDGGIEKKIELEKRVTQGGAFCSACKCGEYLVLLPYQYPAIVVYDTVSGGIRYFEEHLDVAVKRNERGEMLIGGQRPYKNYLFIASPTDNYMYKLNVETGHSDVIELPIKSRCGCAALIEYADEFWLLPYRGSVIVCWKPETGEVVEYSNIPEGFQCKNPENGNLCEEFAFATPAFYEEHVFLPPMWGNMFLKLNRNTGEIQRWEVPFEEHGGKAYPYSATAAFTWIGPDETGENYHLFYFPERKLYCVNLRTDQFTEMEIKFSVDELKEHEPGFCEDSEWLRYCCRENAFNSLTDLLDGNITGDKFDKSRQLEAYQEIVANYDGRCGEKLHEYVCGGHR